MEPANPPSAPDPSGAARRAASARSAEDDPGRPASESEPPRSLGAGLRARSAGIALWWRAEPSECRATDLELLDASELERAARFAFPRDRALFTSAHALLRRALGARLDTPPRDLRFDAEPRGKPCLERAAAEGVAFNLSHTRGAALVGLGPVAQLGVDVESGQSLR